VETREQAELLREQGCREVQGYLYGRPMSAASMHEYLATPLSIAEPATTRCAA